MKYSITGLFSFWAILAFAQVPTGDIEKDTALANSYFNKIDLQSLETLNENVDLLKKAMILYESHPFDVQLIEIRELLALGLLFQQKREEAITVAKETIELAEKEFGSDLDCSILAQSYLVMANVAYLKDTENAIEYGKKIMECNSNTTIEYYQGMYVLSLNYALIGQLQELDSLINESERYLNTQKNRTEKELKELKEFWSFVYRSKVLYYNRINNYDQAILYGEKILADNDIYKFITSPEDLSSIYLIISESYQGMRSYDKSIFYVKEAINLDKNLNKTPSFGHNYIRLSMIYKEKKDYTAAIEALNKGIELFKQDTINYAQTLSYAYANLSLNYTLIKEFDQAIASVLESKRYKPAFYQDYRLGRIYGDQGDYKKAVESMHAALIQITSQFKNPDITQNPSPYEKYLNKVHAKGVLSLKGKYYYDWGEAEKNITNMQQGLEVVKLSLKLEEAEWEAAKGFDKSTYNINHSMLVLLNFMMNAQYGIYELEASDEIFNEFFYLTEKRKAIQLIETLSPSRLPDELYQEEQKIVKEIQVAGQALDLAIYQNDSKNIKLQKATFFEASKKMEQHISLISKEYPKQNELYLSSYAKVIDIQNKLPENTLFISYNEFLKEKKGFIITISNSNKSIYQTNISDLSAKIVTLNELIQDRFAFQNDVRNEFIEVSHELYKTLIQPIESELEGKTKLMIVLEGQLFHLPFELLLKSKEKKPYNELDFLIKNYEVNYHYSATAFLKLQEKPTVRDNSLLAFAPVFDKGKELNEATRSLDFMVDSIYRSIENFEFIALPNTKKEVKTITKLVKANGGQTNVLLSKNATKDNLARELENQSYQFVHIATHGLVNFKNPKLSALACYSKNEKMDNLMYANEIQFKNINADLVVLSSCESGIGLMVAGEGLIALNRSFIYSGAKNVLFSLWKVSDKYSSELMIHFYKSYFETPSYTTALRQAKLKMLENPTSAQPKYWSPFVLMGQ